MPSFQPGGPPGWYLHLCSSIELLLFPSFISFLYLQPTLWSFKKWITVYRIAINWGLICIYLQNHTAYQASRYLWIIIHYKIPQFYRRKTSVGAWLEVRRWFFYRRHHRRITSVGITFVGDSNFRRHIGRKNKKTICRWFYRRKLRAKKKKIPAWNIPTDFHSVGDIVTDRRKIYVGKSVRECMKYRPNISVCKFVGTVGSYC